MKIKYKLKPKKQQKYIYKKKKNEKSQLRV